MAGTSAATTGISEANIGGCHQGSNEWVVRFLSWAQTSPAIRLLAWHPCSQELAPVEKTLEHLTPVHASSPPRPTSRSLVEPWRTVVRRGGSHGNQQRGGGAHRGIGRGAGQGGMVGRGGGGFHATNQCFHPGYGGGGRGYSGCSGGRFSGGRGRHDGSNYGGRGRGGAGGRRWTNWQPSRRHRQSKPWRAGASAKR
ncbi:hypothetical protein PVAP13_9NG494500 [Panicum virgatum]|uniref:Uncharacterized protein n=1 Tax=Panicum virgatum TaxID=38727 RepID=A0A8T0MQP4_PANVG|nr:hypothetical protein PVAP13_9NG494500 [Panicum virgatum]